MSSSGDNKEWPKMCRYKEGTCPHGANCRFIHTQVVASAPPNNSKKVAKEKVKEKPGKINKSPVKNKVIALKKSHENFLKTAVTRVKGLLKEKQELKMASDEFDKKYVSLDVKGATQNPFADKLKLNDLQMAETKSMVKDMFRGMNVPIKLVVVRSVNNTSSNTNVTVVTMDPAYSGEFPSCAALFEQVRVRKVVMTHRPCSYFQNAASGTTTTSTIPGCGYISIDTVTNTPMATISDALDSSNHAEYKIGIQVASSLAFYQNISHCTLEYHPPTPFDANSGSGVLVEGAWTSTIGSIGTVCIVGYLKYVETNSFTATTAQVGVTSEMYHCEFRMRD